jgi:hypothetical protein
MGGKMADVNENGKTAESIRARTFTTVKMYCNESIAIEQLR